MLTLTSLIALLLFTSFATGILLFFFKKTSFFLDIPNNRSSHIDEVPTAGGLSIVFSFLILISVMLFNGFSTNLFLILLYSCLAISILSLIDDSINLSPFLRIIFHLIIAISSIFLINDNFKILELLEEHYGLSQVFILLVLIAYLVWMTNLYNFMDGINGIAIIQSITTFFGLSFIFVELDIPFLLFLNLGLGFICLGFLPWNFPKAKIFMGDTSACFLGLIIGILSLIGLSLDFRIFWCYFLMMSFFIYDATFTLFYRLHKREKIHEAHRKHIYQLLASSLRSHTRVTVLVFLFNSLWLFPICLLYFFSVINIFAALICSFLPVMFLFIYTRSLDV